MKNLNNAINAFYSALDTSPVQSITENILNNTFLKENMIKVLIADIKPITAKIKLGEYDSSFSVKPSLTAKNSDVLKYGSYEVLRTYKNGITKEVFNSDAFIDELLASDQFTNDQKDLINKMITGNTSTKVGSDTTALSKIKHVA